MTRSSTGTNRRKRANITSRRRRIRVRPSTSAGAPMSFIFPRSTGTASWRPKQRVLPNLLVDPLAVLQIINVRPLEPYRANLSIGVLEREQPWPGLGLEDARPDGQQPVARPQQ